MASPTTAPEALRTLRQRGSMVIGVIAMIVCFGFAIMALLSGFTSLVFLGLMLLAGAAGWVLFTRPSVVITLDGVHLNNPIRRTDIPWSKVQDVSARWNLEIWSDDKTYAAWAIASHIERPRGAGLGGLGSIGRRVAEDAGAGPPVPKGTTVGSAALLIEDAKDEWAELVAEGRPEGHTGGSVTRRWELYDILALGVPLVIAGIGFIV